MISDDELDRAHAATELALARARIADEKHRGRMLSDMDPEELSGVTSAIVEGTLKATANGHQHHQLEIATPGGFTLRGAFAPIITVMLLLAGLFVGFRLFVGK